MKATLNENEIETVQLKINAASEGTYQVSDIFGSDWDDMFDKFNYGRRFYQSVCHGHLKCIRYHDRLLDNHRTYAIYR